MKDRFENLEVKEVVGRGKKIQKEGVELNCPACGRLVSSNDNFCFNCGGDLRRVFRKNVSHQLNPEENTGDQIPHQNTVTSKPGMKGIPEKRASKKLSEELTLKYLYLIIMGLVILMVALRPHWFDFVALF